MTDIFVNLFLGHLVGDYVCQSKSMAIKKGSSNSMAILHVSIYTLAVLLFTISIKDFNLIQYYLWAAVIFIPHFVIDRFSLADAWLKLINGRSLGDFYENGHKDIKDFDHPCGNRDRQGLNYQILRGGFTSLVYAITDNTFHLICLWYGYKLIFN